MTVDVVTPMVNDPETFGVIAATNALSDVYAMGGQPEVALSFVGFPTSADLDGDPLEILRAVLHGMATQAVAASCAIVGGHTIVDPEPKAGLSVTGSVERARVWSHRFARAGDRLVLTKPLGTGVVVQALKKDAIGEADAAPVVAEMRRLNRVARDLGRDAGARAATDVTGFGLLGHLKHMADASGVTARLSTSTVPMHAAARALAEAGHVPGGTRKNLQYVAGATAFDAGVSEIDRLLLADAQTSGGLLLSVPPAGTADLVRRLIDAGHTAAEIGTLEPREEGVALRIHP